LGLYSQRKNKRLAALPIDLPIARQGLLLVQKMGKSLKYPGF
jgi:hypothetical protein